MSFEVKQSTVGEDQSYVFDTEYGMRTKDLDYISAEHVCNQLNWGMDFPSEYEWHPMMERGTVDRTLEERVSSLEQQVRELMEWRRS